MHEFIYFLFVSRKVVIIALKVEEEKLKDFNEITSDELD